jgi:2,3-bisphosphoglycerate-independent phosphoglycerate mutase
MRYVILVGDGMGDYPQEKLCNKTPLQFAETPNMDFISKNGMNGLARTIPEGIEPGSDIANLSILGYDPRKVYTGRGPLEAAGIGISVGENETAFRCNLITEHDGLLVDYSAGHISNDESEILISFLNEKLGDLAKFYHGISYRNVLVLEGEIDVRCVPPHDVVNQPVDESLPVGKGNEILREMIARSRGLLDEHEINRKRIKDRKRPANMIWPWGAGKSQNLPPLSPKFDGAVIAAVTLIRGIGKLAGLHVFDVPGATGGMDTSYENKAKYAIRALKDSDLVFIHVEAPDEASHTGDLRGKIEAIEKIDEMLRTIMDELSEYKIMIMPDHFTPVSLRTHSSEPVPFAIYSTDEDKKGDLVCAFDEESAKEGCFGTVDGARLMDILLDRFTEGELERSSGTRPNIDEHTKKSLC